MRRGKVSFVKNQEVYDLLEQKKEEGQPVSLGFDNKQIYTDYLPGTRQPKKIKSAVVDENPNARMEPPKQQKKGNQKIVLDLRGDDSDCSCTETCACGQSEPSKFPQQKFKYERRRRRKKNQPQFFESDVLEFDRIARINFFTSSEDSDDSQDSGFEYKTKIYSQNIPPQQSHFAQPPPQPQLSQANQFSAVVSQYQPPLEPFAPLPPRSAQIPQQQIKQQKQTSFQGPIGAVDKKFVQQQRSPQKSQKQQGKSSTRKMEAYQKPARKRYETPKIYHPEALIKPRQAPEIKQPQKPLYRKPKERVKKPKSQQPPLQQRGPVLEQVKPREPVKKQKEASSSDSCDCCSDCSC